MPFNVAVTLDQVLQLYLPKLEVKRVQIEKGYQPEVEIRGFPGKLGQLFSNLIINALDAMNIGGRLPLSVERGHDWKSRRRPGVRIAVGDTGAGIRRDDIRHTFEPFHTTKTDAGTGLGLWLSHSIGTSLPLIKLHN